LLVRRALIGLAALVVLAGCGSGGSDESGAASKTSLTISVVVAEGATPKVMRLTCNPAGGDHPQPAQACAVLAKAGAKVFKPVPKGQVCSMLYGGPQTATVKGTYDGSTVDATFTRTNGCETDRWEKLGTTFFDVPMQ
jgi:hypothetical protein